MLFLWTFYTWSWLVQQGEMFVFLLLLKWPHTESKQCRTWYFVKLQFGNHFYLREQTPKGTASDELLHGVEREDMWVIWNGTYECIDIQRAHQPVATICTMACAKWCMIVKEDRNMEASCPSRSGTFLLFPNILQIKGAIINICILTISQMNICMQKGSLTVNKQSIYHPILQFLSDL